MKLRVYLIILLLLFTLPIISIKSFGQNRAEYNITQHGAIGDGKTLNTQVIQQVIDLAFSRGGGKVIIPAGRFITGSLELKDNIELYLEKDAVLLGSTNPADYHKIKMPELPETPKKDDLPHMALLVAYKATNLSISGEGIIDGQGTALALNIDSLHHAGIVIDPNYSAGANRPNEKMRPKLIGFEICKQVSLKNVTFKSASCWGLTFELCTNLVVDGIQVINRAYWNNDGLDITDCKNVRIVNCSVNSADDGICLKSYYPGYCDDSVYVGNCTIISGASAVKFGTASFGGFKNITIENIKIKDTYRSAIAIECVDGGVIDNIKVEHIDAVNTGNAIFIRLGKRTGNAGSIKNIYLHDIKVQIPFIRGDINYDVRAEEPGYHNPFPSSITGIPGHNVQNVVVDQVEISYPGRASKAQAYFALSRLDQFPEKTGDYPEFSMFGEIPAWAFYVRHAEGVTFKNIKLSLNDTDYRPALIFQDVKGLHITNLVLTAYTSPGQIVLKCVEDEHLDDTSKGLTKSTH
ncbi:glycoside hydrolase family 28 protein [Mucilaginibacter sp.]